MLILNENGKIEGNWKKCKKKQYIVKARKDENVKEVYNCLERSTVAVREDEIILRGLFGEEWPIGKTKFLDRYESIGGGTLDELAEKRFFAETDVLTRVTDELYFSLFIPKEKECAVYGMPSDKPSEIKYKDKNGKGYRAIFYANSKESISDHGNGDFVVCQSKNGYPDFDDVWVIDGKIFSETYRIIE